MRLSRKIVGLLGGCFLLMLLVLAVVAGLVLLRNQQAMRKLLSAEMVEVERELTDNSGALFFNQLDAVAAKGHPVHASIDSVCQAMDPDGRHLLYMNLAAGDPWETARGPALFLDCLTSQQVEQIRSAYLLEDRRHFFDSNRDAAVDGSSKPTEPYHLYLRLYDDGRTLAGYGKALQAPQVRLQFVQHKAAVYYQLFLGILLVTFLLTVLAFFLFAVRYLKREVSGPIEHTTAVVNRARRDLAHARIEIVRNDEIGELAVQINEMFSELLASRTKLERYNEQLEEQVERRTRDLKSSEELMRAVIESSEDGILVVDGDDRITHFNHQLLKLWRIPASVLRGAGYDYFCRHVSELLVDPDTFRMADIHPERHGKLIRQELALRDGHVYEQQSYPLIVGGESWGRVLGYHDITERVRGEKRKIEMAKELTLARKMESIGTLAAGMAHEINTPLQYIENNLSFLKDGVEEMLGMLMHFRECLARVASYSLTEEHTENIEYLDKEIPQAFSEIRQGIKDITGIIQALKEYAKAGNENRELIDLSELVERVVVITRGSWQGAVDLALDLDKDLPRVFGYPADMSQVLINLLMNAVEAVRQGAAGKRGEGHIWVRVYSEAGQVFIAISDNGSGIPPEMRESVFDPFFTTKDVGQGLGHGLAYAHRAIVDRHQGRLWFESRVGGGTIFYVQLPAGG